MKKTLLILSALLAFCFELNAQTEQGAVSAPGAGVKPFEVNVSELPSSVIIPQNNFLSPRGNLPDDRYTGDFGTYKKAIADELSDGPALFLKSWAGPSKYGWLPADADIAVGPSNVMVVTNEQFHIYSRDAALTQVQTNTLQTFFNRAGKSIFDPKVVYDPWSQRWIMMALETDGLLSYYWIAFSKTNSPTGSWWVYKLNAHIDGSTTTQLWADYPGLGLSAYGSGDSTAIFITSNQYNQAGVFQYGKIRVIKGKAAYNGETIGWWDFWNNTDLGGNKSFTTKPAVNWFSTSYGQMFLINSYGGSNNYFTVWRIDKPLWHSASGGITLTRQSTITVEAYTVPTSTKQPGGVTVDAFDCRTQDVIYMLGRNSGGVQKHMLYTALPSKYVWGAGDTASIIKYYKLNVSDNVVDVQGGFGASLTWYTFPKPAPCMAPPYNGDSVVISFIRGSATVYNESRVVSHDRSGFSTSSYLVQAGTGHYGSFRFGDYSGACVDPLMNGRVWVVSMTNKASNWGSGIGYVSTTPIGITRIGESIPDKFTLEQNYPNPFNPVTMITYLLPSNSDVKLIIYNSLGQEVASLVNIYQKAGKYKVDFNAGNMPGGAYFCKISAGNYTQTIKMLMIK
ncbi:MAG: T9SS type A sorting domain-containing protein [Ignavibacteriae bacterium]|nr:T9SS type A sorting domain-containing protein [Ignavibacteriota bacterium]